MIFQFTLFGNGGFDPTKFDSAYDIYPLLLRVVDIALGLIGSIAFLYIVVAGIQYVTAGGVESKQAEAKKTIQAAIIGIIIVLSAFSLTQWLLHELKLNDTIKQEINTGVQQQSGNKDPVIQ